MKKNIAIFILTYFLIPQDTLVIIDDQIITKTDFIKRAEYTVRPKYCNTDNNIDKKIILNSLIAEKLLALENNSELDIEALRLLKGIKEQTMRRVMLEDQVNHHLIIDTNIILDLYNRSLFDYQIDFLNIVPSEVKTVIEDLKSKVSFNDIAKKIKKNTAQKTITFFNSSNKKIHQKIYNNDFNKDHILEPLEISDNSYILIKIRNKKKNVIINPEYQQSYYKEIEKYYLQSKSCEIRKNYIEDIMSGKKIEFNEASFFSLANYYYNEEKDTSINTQDILFTLDNKEWKIEDLIEINHLNPLLFRGSYSNQNEFYSEFKLALVDLIQNYYLTKKAYNLNYLNHPIVSKETKIWYNYILANYEKEKIIDKNQPLPESYNSEYKIIENILDKKLENLFIQYSDRISIDVDVFNGIKLSNIDMLVINTNQPYQLAVPPFPRLTTKSNLDYGVKKDL